MLTLRPMSTKQSLRQRLESSAQQAKQQIDQVLLGFQHSALLAVQKATRSESSELAYKIGQNVLERAMKISENLKASPARIQDVLQPILSGPSGRVVFAAKGAKTKSATDKVKKVSRKAQSKKVQKKTRKKLSASKSSAKS